MGAKIDDLVSISHLLFANETLTLYECYKLFSKPEVSFVSKLTQS
jgi:hypothetical protein